MLNVEINTLPFFPIEASGGVNQIRIYQRVIRARDPNLSELGVLSNETKGNAQNLDMASELMRAMELHSATTGIQVCWMNLPNSYDQHPVDLVFVRVPFLRGKSKSTVLVRLQTDVGMGSQLQEAIVSRLGDSHARNETIQQLIAPNHDASIDLSSMNADHCMSIPQSVFEIAKLAYLNANPAKTYLQIRRLMVTNKVTTSKPAPNSEIVSLDDIVRDSKFFRRDPDAFNAYLINK